MADGQAVSSAARVQEFLFMAAALPLVGGTAGPACPVAVL